MRAARFDVSTQLLEQQLGVPLGARIIGASFDFLKLAVTLVVDDPSLPEAPAPHDLTPTLTVPRWDWCLPKVDEVSL